MAIGTLRASAFLHQKMLGSILRAPISYFDTTPIGRIVNRFSKDTEVTDNAVPMVGVLRYDDILILSTVILFLCIIFSVAVVLAQMCAQCTCCPRNHSVHDTRFRCRYHSHSSFVLPCPSRYLLLL